MSVRECTTHEPAVPGRALTLCEGAWFEDNTAPDSDTGSAPPPPALAIALALALPSLVARRREPRADGSDEVDKVEFRALPLPLPLPP